MKEVLMKIAKSLYRTYGEEETYKILMELADRLTEWKNGK